MTHFQIYSLGEQVVMINFGQTVDDSIHQLVLALTESLEREPVQGMIEVVPGYTSVAVYYDPLQASKSHYRNQSGPYEAIHAALIERLKGVSKKKGTSPSKRVEIPVCYGGEYGPDLSEVAAYHQLEEAEVIRLHTAVEYKVYMIGFAPGFPYLGGLDPKLAMPRLQNPRSRVSAGSVGLAGEHTGVYPLETPGGWQIIGRTPTKLFDARSEHPALLKAGDTVLFVPVTEKEYIEIKEGCHE